MNNLVTEHDRRKELLRREVTALEGVYDSLKALLIAQDKASDKLCMAIDNLERAVTNLV